MPPRTLTFLFPVGTVKPVKARTTTRRPRKLNRKQLEAMKEFIRSQRGSLKPRKGEPSALDILLAERRRERHL